MTFKLLLRDFGVRLWLRWQNRMNETAQMTLRSRPPLSDNSRRNVSQMVCREFSKSHSDPVRKKEGKSFSTPPSTESVRQ